MILRGRAKFPDRWLQPTNLLAGRNGEIPLPTVQSGWQKNYMQLLCIFAKKSSRIVRELYFFTEDHMKIATEYLILALAAFLAAVAIVAVTLIVKKKKGLSDSKKISTKQMTTLGVMSALSIVLMVLIRIPFPTAPFLEYDPADVPILISTFLFGPWWGLLMTVVVSVIQGITVSVSSGFIGIIMHIAATGGFVLSAGLIYKRGKSLKRAIIALVLGTVVQTVLMAGMNLVFTPIFMKTPLDVVLGMMIPTIIPFNLIKAGVNAVLTFFIYKFVSKAVTKIFG